MRILIITVYPPMKAPEADYGYYLCEELAKQRIEIHVLTTKQSVPARLPGIHMHAIMKNWSWVELPRLARAIRSCRPDAVALLYIGWVYKEHPMVTFTPTIAKAIVPEVAFITQFASNYGSFPSMPARIIRILIASWAKWKDLDYNFGSLLRDSDRLIFLSDHHRDGVIRRLPEAVDKATVVPPPPVIRVSSDQGAILRSRGRKELELDAKDFVLAYFGYIYPGKGIETLLEAFRIASDRADNLKLVLIGGIADLVFPNRPSYNDEVRDFPRRLGIEDRVIWTGGYSFDSEEPSMYLCAADVGVLPLDAGLAMNNSSFAAMVAHGLPVISTRGVSVPAPFLDRKNVLFCPPREPEALAAAIGAVMNGRGLYETLALGAQQLSKEWFCWPRTIHSILSACGASYRGEDGRN